MEPRCYIDGCTRPHRSRGYCVAHYRDARKIGPVETRPEYRELQRRWAEERAAEEAAPSASGRHRRAPAPAAPPPPPSTPMGELGWIQHSMPGRLSRYTHTSGAEIVEGDAYQEWHLTLPGGLIALDGLKSPSGNRLVGGPWTTALEAAETYRDVTDAGGLDKWSEQCAKDALQWKTKALLHEASRVALSDACSSVLGAVEALHGDDHLSLETRRLINRIQETLSDVLHYHGQDTVMGEP